jgi:hypothetical protein
LERLTPNNRLATLQRPGKPRRAVMVTTIRTPGTREQAIARLAQKARESGVKLRRDPKDGRHYCSSASMPGHWHYVTAVSCDCTGFASHGRCMHHSALLVALGWVNEDTTPETDTVPDSRSGNCRWCNGQGSEPSTELFHGRRVDILVTCWHCRGTGREHVAA